MDDWLWIYALIFAILCFTVAAITAKGSSDHWQALGLILVATALLSARPRR